MEKFVINSAVNYRGHVCKVIEVNAGGDVAALSYEAIPFLPVTVFDVRLSEVSPA